MIEMAAEVCIISEHYDEIGIGPISLSSTFRRRSHVRCTTLQSSPPASNRTSIVLLAGTTTQYTHVYDQPINLHLSRFSKGIVPRRVSQRLCGSFAASLVSQSASCTEIRNHCLHFFLFQWIFHSGLLLILGCVDAILFV